MNKQEIPMFCLTCIKRIQQACSHEHTTMMGGFHFTGGVVWDDLTLVCLDCGANLDELPLPEKITIEEEIP